MSESVDIANDIANSKNRIETTQRLSRRLMRLVREFIEDETGYQCNLTVTRDPEYLWVSGNVQELGVSLRVHVRRQ